MPSCLLVYSSVTGNTRMVAEAIQAVLPPHALMRPIQAAPDARFDIVVAGFWVYRGGPDPRMARYLKSLGRSKVAFFGTLAAYPDSDHARGVIARAEKLLAGNRILGSFLCQGKLAPRIFEQRMQGKAANSQHPMTEERKTRLLKAMTHPDADDLRNAQDAFRDMLRPFF